jgi:flagellar biosynthesis protein FlhF
MKIKEYEASTLKDCLLQVRQDLGPEAVILETQKFRKGGLFGWGAKEAVRIVAATGVSIAEPGSHNTEARLRAAGQTHGRERSAGISAATHTERAVAHGGIAKGPTTIPSPPPPMEAKLAQLEQELRELRAGYDAVRQVVLAQQKAASVAAISMDEVSNARAPSLSGAQMKEELHISTEFRELYERLRRADIAATLIHELLQSLPDFSSWAPQARIPLAESALRDRMAHRIQTSGPITLTPGQQKRVALVGPTGVGKTTTIAKLAAHFALVEKKKVGLLTMDTYRIAAVEQLKTYSQIINIPIQVAYSQADVVPALQALAGCELLLVDTAGRSQKHVMQLSELKNLVEAAHCETHLVLAATTKESDLLDQVHRFGIMPIDRLIFSKLDETRTYGTIYSVAAQTGIPVSYFTTGQKVPEDIEVADGEKFAAIVMNSVAAM